MRCYPDLTIDSVDLLSRRLDLGAGPLALECQLQVGLDLVSQSLRVKQGRVTGNEDFCCSEQSRVAALP
ncbi:hypothetical protein RRG08_019356 [Elysia crispata]|uniref:Uncharacterized protein n=1 Tax=Elysia crispata TaxID=231223 RepID=A0AAE1B6H2_9GAST|nr:hypothetical protein RRG08_019356 [Elysia crispata]